MPFRVWKPRAENQEEGSKEDMSKKDDWKLVL